MGRRPPGGGDAGTPGYDDHHPVTAGEVLAARRALAPGRSLLATAEAVYLAMLTLVIFGLVFSGFWSTVGPFFVDLTQPYRAVVGAPALLLLFIVVMRFCTWQGFASFTEADCAYLLTAPVPRAGLVWPRLRNAGVLLGIGGATAAILVGVASGLRGGDAARLVIVALAGFATGVGLVAAGWQVQRLPRVSLLVLRLTIPALALAAVLALGERSGGAARLAVLWSGPWGWSILSADPGTLPFGVTGLALLFVAAGGGWIGLRRTAGRCSLEGLRARARTRSRVVAGFYSLDARAVVLAPRQSRASQRLARFRLAPPRYALLAIPWRGSLALLRSPLRLAWGCALGGGAMLLIVAAPSRTGTVWGGTLALYLAASSLLEPVRIEADGPSVSQILLPWPFGKVLWLHCLLPAGLLVILGGIAIAGGWAAGLVDAGVVPAFCVFLVPMTFVVVLAAALSARRGGRMPTNILLLTAGDPTGVAILGVLAWAVGWALLSIVLVALTAHVVLVPGIPFGRVGTVSLGLAATAAALQRTLLGSRG